MLTPIAESVFNAYLQQLLPGGASCRSRKSWLRRARRWLLKLGDPDVIAQLDGFKFKTPFSSNILLSHFEFPFYDTVLPRLAKAVANARGPLVLVDVGANVGTATYLVSRQTPGRFFCVEANPRFQASLDYNLAQIPGSRARFVALTDEPAQRTVKHNYTDGNSCIESDQSGGTSLEFVTLDQALAAAPDFAAPNLVKIDTEGFELKILRGAWQTLERHRPALFLEFFPSFIRRESGHPDELFQLLRQHGYDSFIFYDGGGHLLAQVGGEEVEKLKSLRRYCDLRQSFFDVAAFHSGDAALGQSFLAAEAAMFEQTLAPAGKPHA